MAAENSALLNSDGNFVQMVTLLFIFESWYLCRLWV